VDMLCKAVIAKVRGELQRQSSHFQGTKLCTWKGHFPCQGKHRSACKQMAAEVATSVQEAFSKPRCRQLCDITFAVPQTVQEIIFQVLPIITAMIVSTQYCPITKACIVLQKVCHASLPCQPFGSSLSSMLSAAMGRRWVSFTVNTPSSLLI